MIVLANAIYSWCYWVPGVDPDPVSGGARMATLMGSDGGWESGSAGWPGWLGPFFFFKISRYILGLV